MPYDIVLFELEGVLAETGALRRDALRASLATEGIALPDDVFAERCAGLPTAAAVAAAVDAVGATLDDTGREIVALRAERHFTAAAGQGIVLVPGARELVEASAARARLGVVTRAGRDVARAIIALAGLEPYFQVVVTADDRAAPKPSPEPYRLALSRLGRLRPAFPERTLALEDGAAGIQSASAAGIRCLAVGALPAHAALDACGALPSLTGVTPSMLAAAAGATLAGREVSP
ncbi:MAG TPA: HAD family phosphatase [Gemmatimonadaceae bacterium]|nr:HAD family phosphatase [Gemmatimonadaceae bacterium]